MHCVTIDAAGYVVAVNPQPAEVSGCAMVIAPGSAIVNNPFALTEEQGAEIGAAIAGLWVIAGVARIFRDRIA